MRDDPRVVLTLLGVTVALLFADQNLMAPNLTQIAVDLGLTPLQRDVQLGGYVSVAFFLCGGVVSLWVGRLADRASRRHMLLWTVLLGEVPCLLTAYVDSFAALFVLRALTGIAIGGAAPLIYSLLGDLVEPDRRPMAVAMILVFGGGGVLMGQVLAAWLGSTWGWRVPFVVVAVPNMLLALVVFAWIREPRRGGRDRGLGSGAGLRWRSLLACPFNSLIFAQGLTGTIPWAVLFIFLHDYLVQDCGYGMGPATVVIASFGLAAIVGVVVSGALGRRLHARGPRAVALACAVTTGLATIPFAILLHLPPSLVVAAPTAALVGLLAAFAGPNLRALLLDRNAPRARGRAIALLTLTDDLGKGLAPALVALLIVPFGRAAAFDIALGGWLISALLMAAMAHVARPRTGDTSPAGATGLTTFSDWRVEVFDPTTYARIGSGGEEQGD